MSLPRDSDGKVKAGPGRPKGSANKSTKAAREFIAILCDDIKVQAAVRRKVLKGDTAGFFKALDKIVPDAPKDVNIRGEFKMIEWPGVKDIAEE